MPILPGNAGSPPRHGFGIWTHPAASAALELMLVLMGSLMYWRASKQVSTVAGQPSNSAKLCAGLCAAFGILVLCLDYSS